MIYTIMKKMEKKISEFANKVIDVFKTWSNFCISSVNQEVAVDVKR